ncbi:peptidyl-prolyl cis-trans isomerase [Sedimentimonas flavescens]|uniref:peptidylprolyl isomerase n=1 Tax=Sedimentimonas flavescens TaxID=2851012 RepID=UPI001C49EC2A|nr:peptidylprolyl isomerase [Sedimentimonas flavescens]MBW0159566.1 peptidyl-prolyl cis-trans isomerase [Sedimentimonas flavescens]
MLLKRIVRSPLVHFFVLGGLVFALFAVMNPGSEASGPQPEKIVLSPETASLLVSRMAESLERPPTSDDIRSAMEAWAIEEALVREARALGLDHGDEVIRNRLQQKVLYLAEAPAAAQEPDEASLQAFYDANAARFEAPGIVSFQHVLLSSKLAREEIDEALAQLRNGAAPESLGAAQLIPPIFEEIPLSAVDRVFGAGFAQQVATLPQGQWTGPVSSGFGPHLVYLYQYAPGELPELEAVRDKVVAEWRAEQVRAAREAFVETLLSRYDIEMPDADTVTLQ